MKIQLLSSLVVLMKKSYLLSLYRGGDGRPHLGGGPLLGGLLRGGRGAGLGARTG